MGLPADRFPEWRKGQDRALRDLLFSEDRYNLLCIPTGGGKTAVAMGYLGVDEGRGVYLTATRALQDQVTDDCHSMGLIDVRGRQNYTCNIEPRFNAAEAKCTAGVFCSRMKEGGCDFYDTRREGRDGRLVITNYRAWLHDEESGSMGNFSNLILDEAHRAPDEISDYAAVEVKVGELKRFGLPEPRGTKAAAAVTWATWTLDRIDQQLGTQMNLEKRRALKGLQRRLARLCRLSGEEWLGSMAGRGTWRWDLVDPGALAEQLLFRGAKRVVLMSASMRRKGLQLLGVDDQVKVVEQESSFPVSRRPIYYWPVAQVGRNMTGEARARLHRAMDTFIGRRLDRKGISLPPSYDLAEEIYRESKFRETFMLHKRGEDATEVLARFRKRRPPCTLISPAFGTGTDLSFDECEYTLIPKVPFPSLVSPLVVARTRHDPDYGKYMAMQALVQNTGRGMRDAEDQNETCIFDSNFGWLRGAHWDFAPRHFHAAIRTVKREDRPPDPPPPLLTSGRHRVRRETP